MNFFDRWHWFFLRINLWMVEMDLGMIADQRRRLAEAELDWETRRGDLQRAILVLEAME